MTLAPAHIPDPRLTFVERVSDTLRHAGVRHVLLHETADRAGERDSDVDALVRSRTFSQS